MMKCPLYGVPQKILKEHEECLAVPPGPEIRNSARGSATVYSVSQKHIIQYETLARYTARPTSNNTAEGRTSLYIMSHNWRVCLLPYSIYLQLYGKERKLAKLALLWSSITWHMTSFVNCLMSVLDLRLSQRRFYRFRSVVRIQLQCWQRLRAFLNTTDVSRRPQQT